MRLALAILAALALAAAAAPPPRKPVHRAVTVDWTQAVATTPSGSYVRGNPAARVKLVEYLSFTCSHCAAYSAEAKAPLDALVRSGRVSVELRHAIRDRFDLTAALLARCRGPARFFAASDAIFAAQPEWLGKAAALPEPADTGGMADALAGIAHGIGLDRIAAPGLPAPRVARCIADPAETARLARMRHEAWEERHIPGTPSFLVNGRPAPGATWGQLEPAIRAALN